MLLLFILLKNKKYDLGILNCIACKIPYLQFVKSEELNYILVCIGFLEHFQFSQFLL